MRHDRASNRMVVSLLGFDFLRSADRMVFLEANLNPSLRQARAELYRGDDPMWSSLLGFCREHGLTRVVVYGYRPFSPSHRVSLQRQAEDSGVQVRFVDDVFACGPHVRERGYFMDDRHANTLIVRAKCYRTLWDAVITNKRLTHDAMTWYNADAALADRVPIPRVLDARSAGGSYDPGSIFPNLVLKEANADRGHGIHFFKGPRLPQLESDDVLVQEFVPPETADARIVRDEEELITVRGAAHVRIFRTHALLTPLGPVHLSGHSVTSVDTLPTTPLPDGFVDAPARFMANFSAGARYGQLRPHEEAWCRDASLRAAQAFQRWVGVKYRVD